MYAPRGAGFKACGGTVLRLSPAASLQLFLRLFLQLVVAVAGGRWAAGPGGRAARGPAATGVTDERRFFAFPSLDFGYQGAPWTLPPCARSGSSALGRWAGASRR